jgi:bifunctional oligoribonuclease and PAP phosphatase NrnA
MQNNFKTAGDLIDSSTRILLAMHERMDGDDGGSVLALMHHLEKMGKDVVCVIKKGVPPYLKFLPGSEKIKDDLKEENFDLIITCGCSSLDRTGMEKISKLNLPIINFDHHPDNTNFGAVNLVDPEKSSVAELVFDFFKFCKWPISKEIATCLLAGIIADTGSFMHSNTKPDTLKTAADLMEKGALIDKITKQIYKNKSHKILRAWGKAIENIYYDEKNKIIYSVMTEKDLDAIGELPGSAFEGFISNLNSVPEAKFALFIRQDGQVIKASLRSETYKNTDVAEIAKLFGGGGHKLAAGFSLVGKLFKDDIGKWKAI